jgi:hypothetical protein
MTPTLGLRDIWGYHSFPAVSRKMCGGKGAPFPSLHNAPKASAEEVLASPRDTREGILVCGGDTMNPEPHGEDGY